MKEKKIGKKILLNSLILLMILSVAMLVLQLNAKKLSKTKISQQSQNSDTVQVQAGDELSTTESENTNISIDDVDWKILTDSELVDVINATKEPELAMFLYSLDEEETALLLSKHTSLINPVTVGVETGETYTDEKGEEWPKINFEQTHDRYYDYLIEEYSDEMYGISTTAGNWNPNDSTDTTTTSSGQFTLKIAKNSDESGASTIITFRVTNVTKGNYPLNSSKYSISTTSNNDGWNTSAIKIEHHLEGQNGDDETWDGIVVEGTFTKPAHYYAKWSVVQTPIGYGRMSTHSNGFTYDSLDHEGAASNGVATHSWDWNTNKDNPLSISAVRIQCHGNNCGLNSITATNTKVRDSITGVIELHKYKESVNLNLNGGTISGGTSFSGYDQDVLTLNTPTKAGYKFTGWTVENRTSGANGSLISSNQYRYCINAKWNPEKDPVNEYGYTEYFGTFDDTTGTTTLKANWENASYTLTVKPNGGTWSGSTSDQNFTMVYQDTKSISNPTRTGYIFAGWDLTGTGSKLSGTTFKMGTENAVLTAKWTQITYIVKYDGNTATGGSTADSTHTYDVAKNLTKNGYTKTGYIFQNWNTKADGTGKTYTDEQSVINLTGTNGATITLYAQWTPITYTVTYNSNAETGEVTGTTADSSHIYDVDKNLTTNGYIRTGHNFKGWNRIADGSGTPYTDGQNVKNLTTIDKDIVTMYAIWEPWTLKANITIRDEETKNTIQEDSVIKIYEYNKNTDSYDTLLMTVDRKADGTYETQNFLTYSDTNLGKFRIIEETAPYGYYGDWTDETKTQKVSHDINIEEIIRNKNYEGQGVIDKGTIKLTIDNTRVKGQIDVNIIDEETQGPHQGDATLEGAVYGLYAKQNIMHADGVSNNINAPDDLVQQATIQNGVLVFTDVELGKYYIKQITPSIGYLESDKIYDVTLEYKDEATEKVYESAIVEERVKKQAFQLIKVGNHADDDELETLDNVGFKIYLISSLEKVQSGEIVKNNYGNYNVVDFENYDFTNEQTALNYADSVVGENIPELFTDENGYLLSPELAYGEYVVIETTTPENRLKIKPFFVKVEEDSRDAKKLRVFLDQQFTSKVKVEKRDTNTNNIVLKANSSYRILNKETNKYVEQAISYPTPHIVGTAENPYTTDATGTFTTPLTLEPGEYELQEVKAPEGYVLLGKEGKSEQGIFTETPKDNVSFVIVNTSVSEYDEYTGDAILKVTQYNEQQVGSLTITAKGEFLNKYTKEENGNTNFEYQERPIEGIEFGIYAKEEIYSQDNQGNIVYIKDQEVAKATTNAEGKLIIDNLPLGKYYIKVTKTVEGFVTDEATRDIEFVYQGQDVPVIYLNEEYTIARQKVEIDLTNKNENEETLPGGTFGIYTKDEITYIDENGEEQEVAPDELIYTVTANENGIAKWNKTDNVDLPLGTYYIKQIKAPDGYILNTNTIDITTDGHTEEIIKISVEMYNTTTSVKILKTNVDGSPISGAELQIIDSQGNIILTLTTTSDPYNITGLKTGEEYTLKEVKPASGYVTGEAIKFSLDENGNIIADAENMSDSGILIMKDEKSRVSILIVDEDTKEPVPGVHVKIVDKTTGKIIYEYDSTEEPEIIEGLPVGEYDVIQEHDKDGYVTTHSQITVEDMPGTQEKELEQKKTQLLITVVDEADPEKKNIEGVEIYIRDKETKEIIASTNPEENQIEIELREDGYFVKGIPVGEHEIEVKVPDGYKQIDNVELKVENTEELQKKEIIIRKLKYDASVDKKLEKVIADGQEMDPKDIITKIEIKSKKVNKVNLKLQYIITVKNNGETSMTIGTIVDELPNGLELSSEDSTGWSMENNVISNNTYKDEILQPGQSKEVRIIAKWINNATNFGEKTNIAKLSGNSNPYGYEDCDKSNDIGKVTSLISVGTGLEIAITLIYIILAILVTFAIVCIIFKIQDRKISK